jgi:Fe-S-cluster containining protein
LLLIYPSLKQQSMMKNLIPTQNESCKKESANFGRFESCLNCSGFLCCGIIKSGGKIEPPYLTQKDIEKIVFYTGLNRADFVKEIPNPNTGNIISIMKTKPHSGCVFFNSETAKCMIHSFRPIDCRLFPLDIKLIDNKYYWSVFNYNECGAKDEDILHHVENAETILNSIISEIKDYATYPVPGMDEIGFIPLKQIDL